MQSGFVRLHLFALDFIVLHAPKAPLSGADSPYQGEMSRRDKRGRDAGSAQPRLRGCRKFAAALCLRRPLLFRLAGKEGGEKGRWVTVWCFLLLNSGKTQFQASFHMRLTVRASDYAPPDTGVSNL